VRQQDPYKTNAGAGVQLKLCAIPLPLFKGNISVANCMLLSSLLKTSKINDNHVGSINNIH